MSGGRPDLRGIHAASPSLENAGAPLQPRENFDGRDTVHDHRARRARPLQGRSSARDRPPHRLLRRAGGYDTRHVRRSPARRADSRFIRRRRAVVMGVKRRWLPWAGAILLVGCAGIVAWPSGSPRMSDAAPAASGRPVDASHVERLQRVMVPLVKGMNRPLPIDRIRVGLADDDHINAANAGSGQFIVTRGLLEKANDDHLRGVLAHELAHEDLGHVARTKRLGTGVNIGIALLEQVFPGTSAIAPLAGQLIVSRYTQKE